MRGHGDWLRREAKCGGCKEMIPAGTQVMRCRRYKKEIQRTYQFIYHFACYWENEVRYLNAHPYVPQSGPGRKNQGYTPEEKQRRQRLASRISRRHDQIKTKAMEFALHPDRRDTLQAEMNQLHKEIGELNDLRDNPPTTPSFTGQEPISIG